MLEYANKNGVRIIDAQDMFLQLYTKENVSAYLLDGLHPTVLGHEEIARFLSY
jgi:lysophospholipase L1-like esterase